MMFSNPAGAAAAATAPAYTRALLDVLGSRDPVDVLAELMPWIAERTRTVDQRILRVPEAPGKWSVIEVLQHLADSDLVFAFRLRMILTEDKPPLQAYDQDAWARTLKYREVPLELAINQLEGLRAANVHVLRQLSPGQLDKGRSAQRTRSRERRLSASPHGGPRPGASAPGRSNPGSCQFRSMTLPV